MQYTKLGRSDLNVSRLCLGSMSWGSNSTAQEGHYQMDRCLEAGINFIDTAEMYPTYPVKPETVGNSEAIIGDWFKASGKRADIVIATKVSGPNGGFIRDGKGYDSAVIAQAVEGSLKRLQADVIDLYQLHWPVRGSYHFRQNWDYDPSAHMGREEVVAHMLDVLGAMQKLVDAGKIRHFGLSNESTWGTAIWLRLAEENGLPRVASVQNEYSLLCRLADTDLAELCVQEEVGLLPFTPLAAGMISGKHGPDRIAPNSRRSIDATLSNRVTDRVWPAVEAYGAVAAKHGLDVNAMALAWTLRRPFVASSIFGARGEAQLETALSAVEQELSDEVMADINAVHRAHPMPF